MGTKGSRKLLFTAVASLFVATFAMADDLPCASTFGKWTCHWRGTSYEQELNISLQNQTQVLIVGKGGVMGGFREMEDLTGKPIDLCAGATNCTKLYSTTTCSKDSMRVYRYFPNSDRGIVWLFEITSPNSMINTVRWELSNSQPLNQGNIWNCKR